MKRIMIALLICCLIPAAVFAATDYFSKFSAMNSEAANEAAMKAVIPSALTLSNAEQSIYRLGFAHGYDTAFDTAKRTFHFSDPTFIVNMKSGKFHKPDCYMVNSILLENREDLFCTYEEAIQRGYDPCGKCLKNAAP